jgi:opacity protein-like surface antigen
MNYLHDHPHASRVLLAALAAMALLVALSAAAAAEPVTSDQFAPGWQADARPLYLVGMQSRTGRDKYYVPAILPRGEYVLIRRTGDKAELMDYRFSVTSDNAKQYLFLDPGYAGSVEAVPLRDVPSLRPRPGAAAMH